MGRAASRDPHARPLGQHRRAPGHGPGGARVRRRLDLLRRRRACATTCPASRSTRGCSASVGINAVGLNNVNVHATEARLLTDHLRRRRAAGRRVPAARDPRVPVGELRRAASRSAAWRRPTRWTPPCSDWWASAAGRVYEAIPDFGGFVVKADSEGQPGPFAYGRDHADGANLLARALAPFGGTVFWRAFVYDHHQDWRDRSTDRARAAYDHFAPLDGRFDDNVVLQVKYGPMDFQTREPVSPVIAAMPRTRLAVELQVTQEYTGQQQHAVLPGAAVGGDPAVPAGARTGARSSCDRGRAAEDHGAATAGRGASSPCPTSATTSSGPATRWRRRTSTRSRGWRGTRTDPDAILDEWIGLTFGDDPRRSARRCTRVLDDSWRTYEKYTAPLGVGFMVRPGHHYGPDVDGYEYTAVGHVPLRRPRRHRRRPHARDRHRVHRPVPAAVARTSTSRSRPARTSCCCSSTTSRTRTCCTAGRPSSSTSTTPTPTGTTRSCAMASRVGVAARPGARRVLRPGHRAPGRAGAQRPRVARPRPQRRSTAAPASRTRRAARSTDLHRVIEGMTTTSTQVQLVRRPQGWPVPEDFRTVTVDLPDLGPGPGARRQRVPLGRPVHARADERRRVVRRRRSRSARR